MDRQRRKLDTVQVLALSFAGAIVAGAVLLALPVASRDGRGLPFLDALFTSASASCVTGLSLYDTATQFSSFGQAVLLVLIQAGGSGAVTLSAQVAVLLDRRIGLRQRTLLTDSVGALQLGGVVRLALRVLRITLIWEAAGTAALAVWTVPRYGLGQGIWMAVFHAVSAFCNAGFDLLGTGRSLASIAGEPLPVLVTMLLVIAGGLGFLVWEDLLTHGRHIHRWRLHSKLVVTATAILLAGGTIGLFLLERRQAFAGAPLGQQLLMSAFQAVTTRTAGFSTVDQAALSSGGTLLTMALMFVGAGSGSTGGGIKVNTLAALALAAVAHVRRQRDVEAFGRRLDEASLRRAHAAVFLYAAAAGAGSMALCVQGIPLSAALFEAVSAIGTVGLTQGVTPLLSPAGKWTVIGLMFAGRVGSMSVVMALTPDRPPSKLRNVPEKILIG